MKTDQSKVKKLSDYKSLDYFVIHVDLQIDLSKKPVESKARLTVVPNPSVDSHSNDLVLDGENMTLVSLQMNDNLLKETEYELTKDSLIIKNIPQNTPFTIETTSLLGENTDLFGLYETEGVALVKAESEGLRRVFYLPDRPDNLATYKATIIANQEDYPVLLSNGVLIEKKELPLGLHSVTWLDDVPKPSYLFALVAGNLQRSVTYYQTKSGRQLPIEFYVPPSATAKCDFAKEVLKEAMAWDERTFNLECALRQHMVAGVDKYASGASEPTGLNLFNTENLFATPETKTDLGILRVLEVVAHEFFHYWSGDRVTIRDWFNLPLKEGLTTFRAAMFREELFGTDLIRLLDGKNLDERAPRQSAYTAVRSLYTAAAYEKSADIFRMMMLFVGKESFFQGVDKFFKDNDGGAVTLEDFIDSLSHSSGKDLHSFLSWFTESGIPELIVTDEFNPDTKQYLLKIKTVNGKNRPVPFLMGLLDSTGKEIVADKLLILDQEEIEFQFENIQARPIPSLLRSFSAPVHLKYDYSYKNLLLLMQYDTNLYNRCEAAKKLISALLNDFCKGKKIELSPQFFAVYKALLSDSSLSEWMLAELITLPTLEELIENQEKPDFEKLNEGRQLIQNALAKELKTDFYNLLFRIQIAGDDDKRKLEGFDLKQAGLRRLKSVCFSYLLHVDFEKTKEKLILQFEDALGKNMTETVLALSMLCEINCEEADVALEDYYHYWKNDPGAVNNWFSIQASAHSPHVIERVKKLMHHGDFDLSNPNKVYALLGSFIKNPFGFHSVTGEGYQLVSGAILGLDKINPTLAANLTEKFTYWDKYDVNRQAMMISSLKLIYSNATSSDVRTMAKKGLDKVKEDLPLPIHLTFHGGSINQNKITQLIADGDKENTYLLH
ncbi:TPA: aminopeptidase N [Legionella pneumophila]|nr:aminopeptidase N [Legionella pneumophila subsp. fraseri]HAT1772242.1 aminopeptidase N [Legionella pneumophila]MDX1846297.1 aminopeptidase N [Legionella pneumophila subsp. fraseri]HAT2126507.1 aminopeptidase N [Legionella pneumophila]HAT2136147.1 aminopeptidase N [Legionella pneumophila]